VYDARVGLGPWLADYHLGDAARTWRPRMERAGQLQMALNLELPGNATAVFASLGLLFGPWYPGACVQHPSGPVSRGRR
jgi:hypothetical protein